MATSDIIDRICGHLSEDLEFLILSDNDGKNQKKPDNKNRFRRQFASYLVSVVTHPIGLKASVSPFNGSVESMLAYLMEMLKFSETQLKKMLVKEHLEDLKSPQDSPSPSVSFKKRHSWRPELRFNVFPPVFYPKSRSSCNQLDNLTVRVYLFKEDQHSNLSAILNEPSKASHGNFLDILKRSRMNPAGLIRPTNEMRHQLRFVRQADTDNGSSYQTVLTKDLESRKNTSNNNTNKHDEDEDDIQSDREICLKIRRYYCEPKSPYILRLEFWLDNTASGLVGSLKRLARLIVHNNCCKCGPNNQQPSAVYSTNNRSLYGFTNVKLSQLPSYASRVSYPILSMRDNQVNSCDLVTEFRNRRLTSSVTKMDDKSVEFVINHIRLYASCVGYQISLLRLITHNDDGEPPDRSIVQSSVTLENLLYLPAYAIINQHRLQGNFSHMEDQSLRRSSLLLLLQQLDRLSFKAQRRDKLHSSMISTCKLLLVSILLHEYSVAHRLFDNRTLQEVDPFQRNMTKDNTRDIIVDIEHMSIQSLVEQCVSEDRLKSWVSKENDNMQAQSSSDVTTLECLRLVRLICDHNQSHHIIHPKLASLSFTLEQRINNNLSSLITRELAEKLTNQFKTHKAVKDGNNVTDKSKLSLAKLQPSKRWGKLLSDIQAIENDLTLHWTEKGLDGLEIDIGKSITDSKKLSKQDDINLRELIQSRISKYLAS